jgi:hypothetical protein
VEEIYLGDGLYVRYDGYQFVLRAPREHGDHFVALELPVYKAFVKYAQNTVNTLTKDKCPFCGDHAKVWKDRWEAEHADHLATVKHCEETCRGQDPS